MSDELKDVSEGLKKFLNKMLIKDRLNFSVSVRYYFSWDETVDGYVITLEFEIDHSKIWKNSPKYSTDYLKLVEDIDYNNLDDKISEYCSYFGLAGELNIKFRYSHYNVDVYNPILDFIGSKKIDFVTEVIEYSPWFEIITSDNFIFNPELIEDAGYNIDNIVVITGNISSLK